MKRLIVALLLLASQAGASTYWVRPGGSDGASGVDSTSNATSLSWFNTNAVAGDTCLMAYGTYTSKIEPRATGTPSQYIVYIGDVTVPYSRVVTAVNIDSSLGATRCISVKGVGVSGDLSFKTDSSYAAGYDSVTYCVVRGQLNINGRDNVTIRYCTIGTGDATDKMQVSNGLPTGWTTVNGVRTKNWCPYRLLFVDSLYIADNTFSLGTSSGGNAATWRGMRHSQVLRNRFRLYGIDARDTHLNTLYDCSYNTISNNYFEGSLTAASVLNEIYILNCRDNFVGNTFDADTFYQASTSEKNIKCAFATSGTDLDTGILPQIDRTYDFGDSNNVFNALVVRVGHVIEVQNKADNNRYLFNTLVAGEGIWLSNRFYVLPDSNAGDSVVWRHNTFFSTKSNGVVIPSENSKLNHAVFAHNIVYSQYPHLASQTRGHYGFAKGSSFTVCDSNLVWCYDPADSLWAVALDFLSGGSACKVGTNSTWGQAPYSYDRNSVWGAPQFADSSFDHFDPQPLPTGLAYSSDLWADGYVGAISVPADVTSPVVTITAPTGSRLWATGEEMTLTWTATDDVEVTGQAVQWGEGSSPLTWSTVTYDLSGSASSLNWTLPSFTTGYATVRILSVDAAGNFGTATLTFRCDVDEDEDGPSYDVP